MADFIASNGQTDPGVDLKTNNKIGIGTTNPGTKLDVVGSTHAIRGKAGTSEYWGGLFYSADGNSQVLLGKNDTPLDVRAGGNEGTLTVKSDGKVGIGTTSPNELLTLQSGDTNKTAVQINNTSANGQNWRIGSLGSAQGSRVGNFQIWNDSGNVNAMEITRNGNVGVGTTGPNGKLEVYDTASLLCVKKDSSGGYNASVLQSTGGTITAIPQAMTSAGIQAAIDYVDSASSHNGGTVLLPAGNYDMTSTVTVRNGIRIVGTGGTLLKANSSNPIDVFNVEGDGGDVSALKKRIYFSNLVFDNNAASDQLKHRAINLNNTSMAVVEKVIVNCYLVGVVVEKWVNAITDCEFVWCGVGIQLNGRPKVRTVNMTSVTGSGPWTVTIAASGSISSVSASTGEITATSHGLVVGDVVCITGTNTTPNINGLQTITEVTANTFKIGINITAVTTGTGSYYRGDIFPGLNLWDEFEHTCGFISSIATGTPGVITTPVAHGLSTGAQVLISGTDTTPSMNGLRTVTVTSATTFTVGVNITTVVKGTGAYYLAATGGSATSLIDTSRNFVTAGVRVNDWVYNQTTGSFGRVSSITTTTNTNDTLNFSGGLQYGFRNGSATNNFQAGDSYLIPARRYLITAFNSDGALTVSDFYGYGTAPTSTAATAIAEIAYPLVNGSGQANATTVTGCHAAGCRHYGIYIQGCQNMVIASTFECQNTGSVGTAIKICGRNKFGYFSHSGHNSITNCYTEQNLVGVEIGCDGNKIIGNMLEGTIASIRLESGYTDAGNTILGNTNNGISYDILQRTAGQLSVGGFLGVGTANPVVNLDVNGGMYLRGNGSAGLNMGSYAGVNFIESAGSGMADRSAADLRFTDMNAHNTWMTIKADGKTGVGTDNPRGRLEISGTRPSASTGQLVINGAGDHAMIDLVSTLPSYYDCGLKFVGNETLGQPEWIVVCKGGTDDLQFINWRNNPQNALTMKSDCKIGMGTTAPDERLHVSGNIKASGSVQMGGDTASASASKAGAIRYRVVPGTPNHAYLEVCMQYGSGANDYRWEVIKDNTW